MSKPKVSIVIAVGKWNKNLDECLAYCGKLDYPNLEIIVLPDEYSGTPPENVTIISTGFTSPGNKRDIGGKHSTGEIIAFLDDDTFPVTDWLSKAVDIFQNDSTVGAVGGPAVTPANDDLSQQASGLVYSSWLVGGTYRYRYVPQARREVDDYPTCNLLVRKDVFDSLGGFDTHFWPGEDTKLCLEITKKLNKKIIYDPGVLVYHHRRKLFRPHLKQVWNYGLHRGYFVKRFPETSLRLSYFLPSLWALGVLFGWLGFFIHPILGYIYLGVIGIYLLAALGTALAVDISEADITKTTHYDVLSQIALRWNVFWGLLVTHFVYGLWFIGGLLVSRLPEES